MGKRIGKKMGKKTAMRFLLTCTILACAILACPIVAAQRLDLRTQDSPREEYEVKAAFLYNFAKFVDWPSRAFSTADSPLVIGVLGDDPFGDVLDKTVAGKLVQGRPLLIKRWQQLDGTVDCHVLFVSNSAIRQEVELLAKLGSSPVLTVGESVSFTEQGGMIRFLLKDNKVRFDINNLSARKARLRISSRLLALATNVWD